MNCQQCADTKKITVAIDGEVTCPDCGYPDSPLYENGPRFDIEEFAEWMCEEDSTLADAMCDTLEDARRYPGWRESSEARRELFRAKAHAAVADGKFIIGKGWAEDEC